MAAHICVRVYACGEARASIRDDEGLESWLSYNRLARPGNALFVDGTCAADDLGYLSRTHADEVEILLRKEIASHSVGTPVWKAAGCYPEDRPRDGFLLRTGIPVVSRRRTGILEEGWHVPDDVDFTGSVPIFAPRPPI